MQNKALFYSDLRKNIKVLFLFFSNVGFFMNQKVLPFTNAFQYQPNSPDMSDLMLKNFNFCHLLL